MESSLEIYHAKHVLKFSKHTFKTEFNQNSLFQWTKTLSLTKPLKMKKTANTPSKRKLVMHLPSHRFLVSYLAQFSKATDTPFPENKTDQYQQGTVTHPEVLVIRAVSYSSASLKESGLRPLLKAIYLQRQCLSHI